jgi:hypothetical protein
MLDIRDAPAGAAAAALVPGRDRAGGVSEVSCAVWRTSGAAGVPAPELVR